MKSSAEILFFPANNENTENNLHYHAASHVLTPLFLPRTDCEQIAATSIQRPVRAREGTRTECERAESLFMRLFALFAMFSHKHDLTEEHFMHTKNNKALNEELKTMRRRQTVLDSPVTNRGLLLAVSYLGEVIRGRQRYSPDCVADTLGKLEEELLHDMNSEDNATAEYLHGPGPSACSPGLPRLPWRRHHTAG